MDIKEKIKEVNETLDKVIEKINKDDIRGPQLNAIAHLIFESIEDDFKEIPKPDANTLISQSKGLLDNETSLLLDNYHLLREKITIAEDLLFETNPNDYSYLDLKSYQDSLTQIKNENLDNIFNGLLDKVVDSESSKEASNILGLSTDEIKNTILNGSVEDLKKISSIRNEILSKGQANNAFINTENLPKINTDHDNDNKYQNTLGR